MIRFKAENKPRIAFLLDGKVEITLTTTKENIRNFEAIPDKELEVTIKEFRPKRSQSQNSYLWVLLNEIAKKIDRSKEDVYKELIKDYGVFEILPIRNEAVESFKSKWGKNGMGWFCEDLGESKLAGYTKLIAYYGSSTYNTQEMKRLIDAVINECVELGINTMSLSEIMLLQNDNDILTQ